jgi:DNA polymerase I-like protein with 3'-5' exonuclease and polymerase domains
LAGYAGDILGANILYDLDYLAEQGITAPNARIRDIQVAEPLLDEYRLSYSLETLAQDYLGEGKREDQIAAVYGPKWKNKMRDVDSRMVASYVQGDLDLPERIHALQMERLREEGLTELYDLECRLIPMLLYMRRLGVPVDLKRAEEVSRQLQQDALETRARIKQLVGFEVNVNAGDSIGRAFDALGLTYGRTAKTGKPSFTAQFLEHHPHPLCALIRQERRALKTKSTFVDGYILGGHIKGRIHCLFHQLRGDENGTVSGRLSSSLPNLQNIPARDPVTGPLMRSMFVPGEPGKLWWSRDWSQIEYRLLVHYGVLTGKRGAAEVAQRFHDDPNTDFHQVVADIANLSRKDAKNLNFGIIYGMGRESMAAGLGRTLEEADSILAQHDHHVPFAKALARDAMTTAARRGYVRTLLGRRARFPFWESGAWLSADARARILKDKGPDWFSPTRDREVAVERWGHGIRRYRTHKALNSVIQGSAADLMKKAMVDIWESGVCNVLDVSLTVHDELDGAAPDNPAGREALGEVTRLMQEVIPLSVPIRADGSEGASWAEAK